MEKKNADKKSERTNPLIFVIVAGRLLYAIFNSLSILALGLFGETTVGVITSYSNRIDDSRALLLK